MFRNGLTVFPRKKNNNKINKHIDPIFCIQYLNEYFSYSWKNGCRSHLSSVIT